MLTEHERTLNTDANGGLYRDALRDVECDDGRPNDRRLCDPDSLGLRGERLRSPAEDCRLSKAAEMLEQHLDEILAEPGRGLFAYRPCEASAPIS